MLGPEARGKRLDRALADRLPERSRTEITVWIRAGRVRVGDATPPGSTRVEGGEQVVIRIPEPRTTHLEPQNIPLDILYEDEAVVVLSKPTGLTVHPGAGQRDGTLANALAYRMRDLPELGGSDRPGIVHRLDKETSGIMVVARTELAQRRLSEAFAARTVSKTYLACTHGIPRDVTGEIDAAVGRKPHHRTKMGVREDGRPARTGWRVAEAMPRHALLECRPVTGRTHQIRVHLKHLGHPIVGDTIYGLPGHPGEELVDRLMLHAWRLGFPHPMSGEAVAFEATPPRAFDEALTKLRALPPPRGARR
ncbi:MAG: RluA family pseudouridine synthase [Planctomycetota bacterium]|nr:RluA family pseudouridine synthase [Planctomycetota bacterium]